MSSADSETVLEQQSTLGRKTKAKSQRFYFLLTRVYRLFTVRVTHTWGQTAEKKFTSTGSFLLLGTDMAQSVTGEHYFITRLARRNLEDLLRI